GSGRGRGRETAERVETHRAHAAGTADARARPRSAPRRAKGPVPRWLRCRQTASTSARADVDFATPNGGAGGAVARAVKGGRCPSGYRIRPGQRSTPLLYKMPPGGCEPLIPTPAPGDIPRKRLIFTARGLAVRSFCVRCGPPPDPSAAA